jgi:hypothetical protein
MDDDPCRELEDNLKEAWEKVKAVQPIDFFDPSFVTKPLSDETPPKASQVNPEYIKRRRQYDDLAVMLRKCYEEKNIPNDQQTWPRDDV